MNISRRFLWQKNWEEIWSWGEFRGKMKFHCKWRERWNGLCEVCAHHIPILRDLKRKVQSDWVSTELLWKLKSIVSWWKLVRQEVKLHFCWSVLVAQSFPSEITGELTRMEQSSSCLSTIQSNWRREKNMYCPSCITSMRDLTFANASVVCKVELNEHMITACCSFTYIFFPILQSDLELLVVVHKLWNKWIFDIGWCVLAWKFVIHY